MSLLRRTVCSDIQEIPRLYRNRRFTILNTTARYQSLTCRIQKNTPSTHKTHFNIFLSPALTSSELPRRFRISNQTYILIIHFPCTRYMHAHLVFLRLISIIIFGEAYNKWSSLTDFFSMSLHPSQFKIKCINANFIHYT